jgi:hypothetical protein
VVDLNEARAWKRQDRDQGKRVTAAVGDIAGCRHRGEQQARTRTDPGTVRGREQGARRQCLRQIGDPGVPARGREAGGRCDRHLIVTVGVRRELLGISREVQAREPLLVRSASLARSIGDGSG